MSYRALYRVFRPQTFAEVRGQEHISTTLKNAILTERLAHAYLFWGPEEPVKPVRLRYWLKR